MRIVFTGKSDYTYNRNAILLKGLKKLKGVQVLEMPIVSRKTFNKKRFSETAAMADFVYIPPFRHRDVRFIKSLTDTPVVFDPLISEYMTKVVDYGQKWKSWFKLLKDRRSFNACDLLIAETEANKRLYRDIIGIDEKKIKCLYIGVDRDEFFPRDLPPKDHYFNIGFYGSFIPLQGIPKIIETAHLLRDEEEIRFHLIGSGYLFEVIKKRVESLHLNNVVFPGWLHHSDLPGAISQFDLCLGIFGDSLKADSVIPNKIFHYAGMKKCILTKRTPAIEEVFSDGKDIVLTNSTADEIAHQIRYLKSNPEKRNAIAEAGYLNISEHFNEVKIAEIFLKILADHGSHFSIKS